jgi:hypothetical protein
VRCTEYHEYNPGGGLLHKHHYDEGSLVTIDVMLSPHGAFQGGELGTCEPGGLMKMHNLDSHSALGATLDLLRAPLRGWLQIMPCDFTLQNRICYLVVLCADMSGNDPTRVEWQSASWCSENINTVEFQQAIVGRTGLTSEGRVGDNRSARNPTRCFYARWRGRWMRLAAQ